MDFNLEFEKKKKIIEEYLDSDITCDKSSYNTLLSAMKYSVNAGGKRITYSVLEVEVPTGYSVSYSAGRNNDSDISTYTDLDIKDFVITNTHIVEKIFDLALRKYITKVNGVSVTETRVPPSSTFSTALAIAGFFNKSSSQQIQKYLPLLSVCNRSKYRLNNRGGKLSCFDSGEERNFAYVHCAWL